MRPPSPTPPRVVPVLEAWQTLVQYPPPPIEHATCHGPAWLSSPPHPSKALGAPECGPPLLLCLLAPPPLPAPCCTATSPPRLLEGSAQPPGLEEKSRGPCPTGSPPSLRRGGGTVCGFTDLMLLLATGAPTGPEWGFLSLGVLGRRLGWGGGRWGGGPTWACAPGANQRGRGRRDVCLVLARAKCMGGGSLLH